MRKRVTFIVSAFTAATVLALPAPAGADPNGTCPDQFLLVPAQLVEQGEKKDQNNNGLVCGKFEDDKLVGGPDENLIDDILI